MPRRSFQVLRLIQGVSESSVRHSEIKVSLTALVEELFLKMGKMKWRSA